MTNEQFFDKDHLYPELCDIEIGEELEEFYKVRKHYLIFTEAGKPVYTRYGEEITLAPFFATLSAIIPKIQNYFWTGEKHMREQPNRLRWIEAEGFNCAILRKGNLFYICLYNYAEHKNIVFLDEEKLGRKQNNINESASFVKK